MNWFHWDCTGISKKTFDQIKSKSKQFCCKICKTKTKCYNCECSLSAHRNQLYCVGCLKKYCANCHSLQNSELHSFQNTDRAFLCHECLIDHFCNVCGELCENGCIYCDNCNLWLHYRCTKMTTSQIISYAKSSKKYYCPTCIEQNIPFSNISASKLDLLISSDSLARNDKFSQRYESVISKPCNLCLECNPECTSCLNNSCIDQRRVCETCLTCNYVLDKIELNKIDENFKSKFGNSSLKVIHFNARSLQKHYESICKLLSDSNINFDIIGVSETKFTDEENSDLNTELDLSKIQIDGYLFEHTPTNFAFGGAGLYISKKIDFVFRPDLKFKVDSCETCFFELNTHGKNKNIIVGVIYRHPHENHDVFYTKLQSFAETVLKKYDVIILGDINIDVSIKNSCVQSKTYLDLLLGLGMKNLISKPTRITNTTATILDHIITNLPYDSLTSGILISDITDHLPVFGLFNFSMKTRYYGPVYYRSFFSNKKNDFVYAFTDIVSLLHPDSNEFNPDEYLNNVVTAIHSAVDKVFPLRKRSKKQLKKFKNSWITQGILNSRQKCHQLYYQYLTKRDEASLKIYKSYKLLLVRSIKKAKNLDDQETFQRCSGDSKKTWKAINDFFRKNRNKETPLISLKDNNGDIQTDPRIVANIMNSHFTQKRLNLASKLPNSQSSIYECMGPRLENEMQSNDISDNETLKVIHELKTNKTADISPKLIKWLDFILAPILTKIFNRYLNVGKYPDIFKLAKVTSIPKGGDKLDRDNYRPISVLPQLDHIFEKIMKYRLTQFLDEIKFFTEFQFGFRKGHSTSHGIAHLNEKILESLKKKQVCAALFIDLKSAFDTIEPKILLKKLDHIGIRGKMLLVIESYLKNRKQCVKNGDIESIVLDVLIGVPQGSVLGPLLFIIYINDIVKCCSLSAVLFADDAVFIAGAKTVKLLQKTMNREVKNIFEWLLTNRLTLNSSKTKYMIFQNKKDSKTKRGIRKFKLNINKSCIKQVTEFKYLGIIFDDKLKWQNHIEFLCVKLSKAAGVIYKLKQVAPKSTLKTVYYSIVDSHLRYGITVWGSAKGTAFERLKVIHRKIIKYMKSNSETIADAMSSLKILSVDNLYKFEVNKLVYQMKQGSVPDAFQNFILGVNHRYGTRARNMGNFDVPHPNTERDKTSIKYQGAINWNSLPADIKASETKKQFLDLLKTHFLENV